MKLKENQKRWLQKAYNNELDFHVCEDVKSQLKEVFPKLFPETELEVGRWYTHHSGYIFCFNGEYDRFGYPCGYGVDTYGCWRNVEGESGWGKDNIKPASKESVEKALIKEAKRRGFKKGVVIDSIWMGGKYELNHCEPEFLERLNVIQMGGTRVFIEGKWAKPIETISKVEAEKQLGKVIIDD